MNNKNQVCSFSRLWKTILGLVTLLMLGLSGITYAATPLAEQTLTGDTTWAPLGNPYDTLRGQV